MRGKPGVASVRRKWEYDMKRTLILAAAFASLIAATFIHSAAIAQPAPAVYEWSWNPAEARVRVEAQVFADLGGANGACFLSPPWPNPDCYDPPNSPPPFWSWEVLPAPSAPAPPPVPPHGPPLTFDRYAPLPGNFGTMYVGPYCPSPTSDAQGNPPPPPPPGCSLDWSQRVQLDPPVGLTFQNMLGHPSLVPEVQLTNSVLTTDQDANPFAEVAGRAEQVVVARGQRGLIGTVAQHGVRTWELRLSHHADLSATIPQGIDGFVGETTATIVANIPLQVTGLTPGQPFRFTFDFQTLGETVNANEDHAFLDDDFELQIREDVDNAYALATVLLYDGGSSWLTQFIEYAGDPPGFSAGTHPPSSGQLGGSTHQITPTATTHPIGIHLTSRVRSHFEDFADADDMDAASASMKANVWLTVFGPPVVGEFAHVPATGAGPDYPYWMSRYEVSNVEFVDFLNDAEADIHDPGGPTAKSEFMVIDPDSGEVSTPGGVLLFSTIVSPTPGGGNIAKIRYRPHLEPGTRYVADPGAEPDAVIGVTWAGALKYANWLTLHAGYTTGQRCYTEGDNLDDWHPVTISTGDWATRDLNDPEREELVTTCPGFRLPMDNLGAAIDHVGDQANAYNEWYKASAYDPDAPDTARTGPGGETIPAFHWIYGFGRDTIDDIDANFFDSGDPYDDGVAHIGFFDGVNELSNGAPTRDTDNPYGFHDLAGNVAEWAQDQGPGILVIPDIEPSRITRTGSWADSDTELAASHRTHHLATEAATHVGFRVLTTRDPTGKLFRDRFEEQP
jgi:hypothetical protein